MKELIDEIKKATTKINSENDEIAFSDKRYENIPFSNKNFQEIKNIESDKSMCFVDGGNIEIIKTPQLSIHLIRAAFVIYQNNKKITYKKEEGFAVTRYVPEKNAYSVKMIPDLIGSETFFSVNDHTLKEGIFKTNISKIGEVARRFLELNLAKKALEFLQPKDILIRDGTLQNSVTGENVFLKKLYNLANEKQIVICGFSKSTSLVTKKGCSAVSVVAELNPNYDEWYYYPLVKISNEDHQAELFFAKLHRKAKHIFRIEFYNKSKFDVDEIFSLLKRNARDVQLPGYPYGLISVDKLAKVEKKEAEMYKVKILAQLNNNLEKDICALNAHDFF